MPVRSGWSADQLAAMSATLKRPRLNGAHHCNTGEVRNLSKETTEVRWLDSTHDIGPVVGLLVDKMVKEEGKAPHTIATRSTVMGPDKTIVEIRIAWQLTKYEMDSLTS